MGKALMVTQPSSAIASNQEFNLFGLNAPSLTEANAQVSCTEGAAFTGFAARVTSGNSGTATFQFRDAGANGQQVASISGTGVCEDTTHTDTLSAGDLFNIAYTDTGTDSTVLWAKMNVEFASGHGNFHGCMGPTAVVFDVASSTRYISYSGQAYADGTATEADAAWKVRGYDTQTALQVRIAANARTNDSTFKNRINGADGGASITFGTGVTGRLDVTGLTDSIADGDTVCASITLDTGVEDLTVSFVVGTFKSSTNESETFLGIWDSGGATRAASSTANYYPIGGRPIGSATDADIRIKPGFAGKATNLRCYLSANTYSGDGTLKLMQNGSAVITTTITASGGAGWYENSTDTVTFDDNDEFSFEIDEGTSGSITIRMMGMTFAPPSAGGIAPRAFNHLHKMSNA